MKPRSQFSWSSLLILTLSFLFVGSAVAQEGVIRGTVSHVSGEPLGGATVQVPELEIGTFTDASGAYVLNVPPGVHRIEARSLGYTTARQTVEVSAGETVTADFRLATRAIDMEEVVVSLAATQVRRAEFGTDIERFNMEAEVEKLPPGNLTDMLNSRLTGVSLGVSSGEVGSAKRIRIRGATSLTQDNNPIIYVDGVRVSNATGSGPGSHDFGDGQTISRLDDLNPEDVASVQVMKGPTAAALYGSEAASGVILIETKRGVEGRHRFDIGVEQGFGREYIDYPDNYYNLTQNGFTNPDEPILQQWRPVQNPVTGEVFARHNPLLNPRTSPFITGRVSNFSGSVRGGVEQFQYYSSLRYEDQQGTLPNNYLERYAFRANLQAQPLDNLDVSVSTGFVGSNIRLPDNDRSSLAMHGNGLSGIPVTSYGTLPDGSRGDCLATVALGQPASVCDTKLGNQHNTFEKLMSVRNEQDLGRFTGSLTANWRPVGWLTSRAILGLDFIQTRDLNLVPLDPDRPFGDDSKGLIEDRRATNQVQTVDLAGTARSQLFEDFTSSTTVGAQYFGDFRERVGCRGEGGFASPEATACDASLIFSGFSDRAEIVEIGAYVQQQLNFRDYLFGTAALRIDDNSAFGENQGAIASPSANVSLLLSSMPFWNVEKLNSFRVRFAWGTAAQAPDPFAARRTFRPVRLEEEGQQVTGISPLAPGNPELTAERNQEFEFGFDGIAFDDRLNFKLSYFTQTTRDAIVQTRVAPSTGFTSAQFVNIGKVENKGFEGVVEGRVLDREELAWDLNFKFSTQDPIVTSLGDELPIMFGLGPSFQMFREGYSPGHIWGVVVEQAERDQNGNIIPESVVLAPSNVNDPNFPNQVALGRAHPSNEQSLSTTLTLWNDLRIFTLFDRAGGFVKYDLSGNFSTARGTTRDWAFRQAELTPEQQAMLERGFGGSIPYFVSNGTFVKWREASLRYQLPDRVLHLAGGWARSGSLLIGARNLATWTDYRGLDPESNFAGGADNHGVGEFRNAPPVRQFFARINLSF